MFIFTSRNCILEMEVRKMFSDRLKQLRTSRPALTQAKFAELLGVSQQAVGLWERGKNMPSHDLVVQIANYFNVSTDYMMCLTDNPYKSPFKDGETTGKIIAGSEVGLTPKEERDIESDLEDMMNSMSSAAYEGDTEADEDVEALKATLKAAMIQAKKVAKKKYTPKKYRRD